MIVSVIKSVAGFVEFSVKGEFPERFLNQLAAHRIPFWDIDRQGRRLKLCVLLRDYKKLHKIKGKNRIITRVLERKGLPFILKRYRLRWGAVIGFALYLGLLFYMSSFIWNINVVGNETVSKAQVLEVCKKLGLYEGVKTSKLDPENLRTRLALEIEGIAWASVNIEGATATVNISESIVTEENDRSACNLLAARDGIIERLEVTEGTIKVKVGQTVKAGDLLVSGITEYKDGSSSFGRSSGKVYATTDRTLSYLATFVQSETVYIGEPKTRTVLSFFGVNVPLYFGTLKGEFQKEVIEKRPDYRGAYLPIKLTTATFKQVDTKGFLINESVAKELAQQKLNELEEVELKNSEILSKEVQFEVLEKGVLITGHYRLRENIAERDLLLIYSQK